MPTFQETLHKLKTFRVYFISGSGHDTLGWDRGIEACGVWQLARLVILGWSGEEIRMVNVEAVLLGWSGKAQG